jgi:hypothetical protein
MLLMATASGKNAPKYGARCKSCSLKYAIKFKQKYWQNTTASFGSFILCPRLCALQKLVGQTDIWQQKLVADIF